MASPERTITPGCAPTTGSRCSRTTSILDPEIRSYLEAENAYMDAAMGDTKELQAQLFAEMKGRIKETIRRSR